MSKRMLILATALVAFAAGWAGRSLLRDSDKTLESIQTAEREPALASVVPFETPAYDPLEAASAESVPDPFPTTTVDQPAGADSVGVLLARHFGQPATTPSFDDYYLYLPPGFERGDRRWPVILYLHGRSLRGHDLSMLRTYGLPRYLADGRALPFVVVAPQLSHGQSWTDVDRLAALVEDVLNRYATDPNRVYLTGYSMGGGGVWRMALAHSVLFAAAAPMAATTPPPSDDWARAVRNLPMRVFHGTADESASFPDAQAMVTALRRAGADVELEAYEGAGHGELTNVYAEPRLYEWFLDHRRTYGE